MGIFVGAISSVDTGRSTADPMFHLTAVEAESTCSASVFHMGVAGVIGNVGGGALGMGFNFPLARTRDFGLSADINGGASGHVWLQPSVLDEAKGHDYKIEFSGNAGLDAVFRTPKALVNVGTGVEVGRQMIGNTCIRKYDVDQDGEKETSYSRNYATPYLSAKISVPIKNSDRRKDDHLVVFSAEVDWSNAKPDAATGAAQNWKVDWAAPTVSVGIKYRIPQ